ncbi:MAG TPA: glycosyltransferase [Actinomycetota bacterium]|nr:glycosyltransferase [Actinomycetota bacterium]
MTGTGNRAGRPRVPELVSVVVPVFNNDDTLEAQLDALLAQDYQSPFEVIVADNGSQDGSKRIAEQRSATDSRLTVIDASGRKGANYARNVGVKASAGELIAFCDGDDQVSTTWLSRLVEASGDCDVLGGRIELELLNTEEARAWRVGPQPDGLPVTLNFLPYGVSANLAVWADALSAVGGWDESFIIGGTEVDLCWRLQLQSYKLCFVPDAVVHYRMRHDLAGVFRQAMRFGRADVMLYRKFRNHGIEPSGVRAGWQAWKGLIRSAPRMLRSRDTKGRWLFRVGFRIGRVRGSARFRTLLL